MSVMLNFNLPEIKNIIKDIFIATKTKCVLYDENFNIIYAYPEEMCPFCTLVRNNPTYEKKCLKCDFMGFNNSLKSRKTEIYKCHMGLTEVISPIIYSDTVIGFIMIGQIMTEDSRETIRKNIESFPDKKMIPELFREFEKLSISEYENLYAVVNIIEMCASYLWLKQLISLKVNTMFFAIKDYISGHLQDNLSIASLCKIFNVSKSTLYALSIREFGKGISEYIRDMRIEKAKQLLSQIDSSVSEIAEQVGFMDTNYFIKVFKQYTGTTPGKWKNE